MVYIALSTSLLIAAASSLASASSVGVSRARFAPAYKQCDVATLRSCMAADADGSCYQTRECSGIFEAYVEKLSAISGMSGGANMIDNVRSHFTRSTSGIIASKVVLAAGSAPTVSVKALALKDTECAAVKYGIVSDSHVKLVRCSAAPDTSSYCICTLAVNRVIDKDVYITFDPEVTLNRLSLPDAPRSPPAWVASSRHLVETVSSAASAGSSEAAVRAAAAAPNQKIESISGSSLGTDASQLNTVSSSSSSSSGWHGIRLFFLFVSFIGNAAFLVFVFWLSK